MSATKHTRSAEPAVQELDASILDVKPGRTSRNGNDYTALVLPFNTWIFVWDDAWRREIEQHRGLYFYLDARLFVRNQTPDAEDPFYWLEAVVPATDSVEARVRQRWQRDDQRQLLDDVAAILEPASAG